MDATPWHAGEVRAQELAGNEHAGGGGAGIRDFMPDQHRIFFSQIPFLVAATVDADNAPVATLLVGGAGFVGSHLTEALLERGGRVRVLDNLATGRMDNLRAAQAAGSAAGQVGRRRARRGGRSGGD